jgi:hypothetical protein
MDADDPTRYTALQSLDSNLSISICSHVQQQSGPSLLPVRCGATVIGGGTHIGGVYPPAHDACRICLPHSSIPLRSTFSNRTTYERPRSRTRLRGRNISFFGLHTGRKTTTSLALYPRAAAFRVVHGTQRLAGHKCSSLISSRFSPSRPSLTDYIRAPLEHRILETQE